MFVLRKRSDVLYRLVHIISHFLVSEDLLLKINFLWFLCKHKRENLIDTFIKEGLVFFYLSSHCMGQMLLAIIKKIYKLWLLGNIIDLIYLILDSEFCLLSPISHWHSDWMLQSLISVEILSIYSLWWISFLSILSGRGGT